MHHSLGYARLIQHQPHKDEHGQRDQNRVFDDIAKKSPGEGLQTLVIDAGAIKFDDIAEEAAIGIEKELGNQHMVCGLNPGDRRRLEILKGFDLRQIPGQKQKSACADAAQQPGDDGQP